MMMRLRQLTCRAICSHEKQSLQERQQRQKDHLKILRWLLRPLERAVFLAQSKNIMKLFMPPLALFTVVPKKLPSALVVPAKVTYTRFTNPTVRTFEQRIAAMEGGQKAVAASSGMAALTSIFWVI